MCTKICFRLDYLFMYALQPSQDLSLYNVKKPKTFDFILFKNNFSYKKINWKLMKVVSLTAFLQLWITKVFC
jgi:hypothetical protein